MGIDINAATVVPTAELPPLPEPTLEAHDYELWGQNVRGDFFTAEQMHRYARAALAAATAAQPADERAAFEAWAAKRAYDTTPNVTWPDLYAESRTQAVWEAWRDRAGATAAQPAIPTNCPHCGTHEVALVLECHNSACAGYAESQTVYTGWKAAGATGEQQA